MALSFDGFSGEWQRIEYSAFFEEGRFRGVHVFSTLRILLNASTTETDNPALFIPDSEDKTVPESVIHITGIILYQNAGNNQLLQREAQRNQMVLDGVPIVRRRSNPKVGDDVVRQPSAPQVFAHRRGWRTAQRLLEESRRRLIHLEKSFFTRSLWNV